MRLCEVCGKEKKEYLNNSKTHTKSEDICRTELVNASTRNENKVLCPLVIDFLVDLMKTATSFDSPLYKDFDSFLIANDKVFNAIDLIGKISEIIKTKMIIAGNTYAWDDTFKKTLKNGKISQYQLNQQKYQLDHINSEIKKETEFSNLLPASFVNCSIIFVATLSLNSKWDVSSQFDIARTKIEKFANNPDSVNMMYQKNEQNCILKSDKFSMGILYTTEHHIQLRLFLPNVDKSKRKYNQEQRTESVYSLEEVLAEITAGFLFDTQPLTKGKLILPRFKIESKTDLTDAMLARIPNLKTRGCDFIEKLGSSAGDFKIFTKVKFTVDESGASVKAAAAAGGTRGASKTDTLKFDRPFIAYFVDTEHRIIYASATYMQGEVVIGEPDQTIVETWIEDDSTRIYAIPNSGTYIGIQVQYINPYGDDFLDLTGSVSNMTISPGTTPEINITIPVKPGKQFKLQYRRNGIEARETQKETLLCTETYTGPDGKEEPEPTIEMKFNEICDTSSTLEKPAGEKNDSMLLDFKYAKTNTATEKIYTFDFKIIVQFMVPDLSDVPT